jgi:uncharacterized protein (DUF1684 family)
VDVVGVDRHDVVSLVQPHNADAHALTVADALDLLDWKRRMFGLYEEIRATPDPETAWNLWRETREELYRTHPQSPLPHDRRASYRDAFFPYDPAFRVVAELEDGGGRPSPIRASTGGMFAFTQLGVARFELHGSEHALELHWNEGYGGGILLAVADETSGSETYGGGRYVLDTVKGADLGTVDGRLVIDFNFSYNPSCAFDSRWSCPLAPPGNRLAARLEVGERMLA